MNSNRFRLLFISTIALGTAAIIASIVYWYFNADINTQPVIAVPDSAFEEQNFRTSTKSSADKNNKVSQENTASGLKGRVFNEAQAGIKDADVLYRSIENPDDIACEERQDVEFVLNGDTYELSVDKEGYFYIPLPLHHPTESHCLILNASAKNYYASTIVIDDVTFTETIEMELQKHASLSGMVEKPDGSSLAKASVHYWTANPATNIQGTPTDCTKPQANEFDVAISKNDGSFELHTIVDNTLCLQASHEDWSSSVIQEVDLSTTINALVLSVRPAKLLSGTVIDQEKMPVAGLELLLVSQNNRSTASMKKITTDSSGGFRFAAVDFGEYQLLSDNPNYQIIRPNTLAVTEDRDIPSITVDVFPITLITGSVLDSEGKPIANAQITSRNPLLPDQSTAITFSDSQGHFSLASQHRSNKVNELLELMNQSTTENKFSTPDSGAIACLSISHTGFTPHDLKLTTTDKEKDVGTIYLSSAPDIVNGKLLNHRGEGLAGDLSFRYSPTAAQEHKRPSENCQSSSVPIDVTADEFGNFSLTPNSWGVFEIEVKTKRYSDRKLILEINDAYNPVEIKLQ